MKPHLGQALSFVGMLAVFPAYAAEAPPAPAPEMQKLKWMVGSWTVSETHEKSEWSPGGKGKGTSVFTLGPGGHSLHYDYKSSGPMGPFAGKGLTAWDPGARAYRAAWTDSVSPGLLVSECREEGKDLVCLSKTEMNGQKVTFRTRSIDPKPSGWTEVLETSADGTSFQKMMTLEYRPKR